MTKKTNWFQKDFLFQLVTGLLSFVFLLPQVFHTIDLFDSGELVTNCVELGVSHPPGYGLHTLAGKIFTCIFFWLEPAYAVNLMSAFFTSLCSVLIFMFLRDLKRDRYVSAVLSVMFVSLPFNLHIATIAEVYSLDNFILLVFLLFFQRALLTDRIHLHCFCLYTAGFAITFRNINLVYLFPAMLVILMKLFTGFKRGMLFFLIPFTSYLYYIIRTVSGRHHLSLIEDDHMFRSTYHLLTSKIYQGSLSLRNMNFFHGSLVAREVLKFSGYVTLGLLGIALFRALAKRQNCFEDIPRKLLFILPGIMLLNLSFLLLYNAMEIGTMAGYFICCLYLVFSLLLSKTVTNRWILTIIFVLSAAINVTCFSPARIDGNRFISEYLNVIPDGAVLYAANDYEHFPYYYRRFVLNQVTRDVEVRSPFVRGYVVPSYRLLSVEQRMVLLTREYYDALKADLDHDERIRVTRQDGFYRLELAENPRKACEGVENVSAQFEDYMVFGDFSLDPFLSGGTGVIRCRYRLRLTQMPPEGEFLRLGFILLNNEKALTDVEEIFANSSFSMDFKEGFAAGENYELTQYYPTLNTPLEPGEYNLIVYAKKISAMEKKPHKVLEDAGYRKVNVNLSGQAGLLKDIRTKEKLKVLATFKVEQDV